MSIEKEKIVGIIESGNIRNRNNELRNRIQHEIQISINELETIYHSNTTILPNNFPLPEVRIKDILDSNHVEYISEHPDKKKFRIIIFQNKVENKVEYNWIPQNGIRFIIEYIVSPDNLFWEESPNGYSARVFGKVDDLKNLFLDAFVDILIEGSISRSKKFKPLFADPNYVSIINSNKKVEFINKHLSAGINKKLGYYPLSSFFKVPKGKSFEYNMRSILLTWQKYLLELINPIESFPKFSSVDDLLKFIPRKHLKQIRIPKLQKLFSQKCNLSGIYTYVLIVKSPNGESKRQQRQLDSVFSGKPKIGNSVIINYSFLHVLNGIEHLVLTINFEKI